MYNLVQFLGFSWIFANLTVRLFILGQGENLHTPNISTSVKDKQKNLNDHMTYTVLYNCRYVYIIISLCDFRFTL